MIKDYAPTNEVEEFYKKLAEMPAHEFKGRKSTEGRKTCTKICIRRMRNEREKPLIIVAEAKM